MTDMRLDQLNTDVCDAFNRYDNDMLRVCRFAYDPNSNLVYKYYPNGRNTTCYRDEFRFEFEVMHQINQECPNSGLFPRYSGWGEFEDFGYPFIAMELIEGITLEQRLRQSSALCTPTFLFTPEQLCHIVDQIYKAQTILCRHGLMYFDLSPSNVILKNQQFDICLIDFTFCYHINPGDPYSGGIYKKIDDWLRDVSPDFPMQLALRQSLYLFFSRLFYPGSSQYALSYEWSDFDFFRTQNGLGRFPAVPYNGHIVQCRNLFDDSSWYDQPDALLQPLTALYQNILAAFPQQHL